MRGRGGYLMSKSCSSKSCPGPAGVGGPPARSGLGDRRW